MLSGNPRIKRQQDPFSCLKSAGTRGIRTPLMMFEHSRPSPRSHAERGRTLDLDSAALIVLKHLYFVLLRFLSTHADWQGVNILFKVCLFFMQFYVCVCVCVCLYGYGFLRPG